MLSGASLPLHDLQPGQRLGIVLQPRPPQDHRPPMPGQPGRRRRDLGIGQTDPNRVHNFVGKRAKIITNEHFS